MPALGAHIRRRIDIADRGAGGARFGPLPSRGVLADAASGAAASGVIGRGGVRAVAAAPLCRGPAGPLWRVLPLRWAALNGTAVPGRLTERGTAAFWAPSCRGVAVLNEQAATDLSRHARARVFCLPDVVDESAPAGDSDGTLVHRVQEWAAGRKIVLYLGGLSQAKKNFLRFVEVSRLSDDLGGPMLRRVRRPSTGLGA